MGLKEKILDLLERDREFRYAVAGLIGLDEILKRLDTIAGEQTKIWSEIAAIREEQTKIWSEIAAIREEQVRLREDFNRMLTVIGRMDVRLSRVERTLEKLTIDVEDEAKSVLKHRLREMGIDVELTSLILPGLELNIYGVSDDVCVVGEATIRAGVSLIDELMEKLKRLRREYPDRLRKKVILVVYTSLPMGELIEEAERRGIWLLKATEEFHRPEKLFHENRVHI